MAVSPIARLIQQLRGLRFRLTASFIIFFTIVLLTAGFVFRALLKEVMQNDVGQVLNEEWGAMLGFLRIEIEDGEYVAHWYNDPSDPEERVVVDRIREYYLLANADGRIIDRSPQFPDPTYEQPAFIRTAMAGRARPLATRRESAGRSWLLRSGVINDGGKRFFAVLARPLEEADSVVRQFTIIWFVASPLLILLAALLGWFMARRALQPVSDVARLAESISSNRLNLRIPTRGANDELDHLIGTVNGMFHRLEESFSQVREFSANVSHELRTPLTVMRGQLEVALMTSRDEAQLRESIISILPEIERLTVIVKSLLQLAQAESGQVTLQLQRIDLAHLCRDVVDQFLLPAEDKGVLLSFHGPGDFSAVVDPLQIRRLLMNLIDNAIKYTPQGKAVRVLLLETEASISLRVEDEGEGIDEEDIPHVFDRFYRVRGRAVSETGVGLGLSFVAWIVRAHNGDIEVQSERGKGTSFLVRLPMSPFEETGAAAEAWTTS
jgi:heavy metal sensor kinase